MESFEAGLTSVGGAKIVQRAWISALLDEWTRLCLKGIGLLREPFAVVIARCMGRFGAFFLSSHFRTLASYSLD